MIYFQSHPDKESSEYYRKRHSLSNDQTRLLKDLHLLRVGDHAHKIIFDVGSNDKGDNSSLKLYEIDCLYAPKERSAPYGLKQLYMSVSAMNTATRTTRKTSSTPTMDYLDFEKKYISTTKEIALCVKKIFLDSWWKMVLKITMK